MGSKGALIGVAPSTIGPYVTSCWLELSMAGSRKLLSISRYMYRCHLDVLLVSPLRLAIAFQGTISWSLHRSLDSLHPTFCKSEESSDIVLCTHTAK